MNEASKTNDVRGHEYFSTYFSGSVIDIGCGDDPVVGHAVRFDQEHGNAERILDYFSPRSFRCVHSSHCLEHMTSPEEALLGWWELVEVGGYMVTVVPDEDLYEQGIWPSIFNGDHKVTFRMGEAGSWSPVSYEVGELFGALPGAEIVSIKRQDAGYDYRLKKSGITAWGRFLNRLNIRRLIALRKVGVEGPRVEALANKILGMLGGVPDQTMGFALAQIEIVVRKTA